MTFLRSDILRVKFMGVFIGIRLESALRVLLLFFLLSHFFLLEVLSQVVNNKQVLMGQPLIRNLNIDRIFGENAIGSLYHLISVLFGEIGAVWVDGGFEWTLLSGRGPAQFFGIVTEQPVSEEAIEVAVDLLALQLANTGHVIISELDVVNSPNCQQKDEKIGLCDTRTRQKVESLLHQFTFIFSKWSVLLCGVDSVPQSLEDVLEVLFFECFFLLKIQGKQDGLIVLQKLLGCEFLDRCVLFPRSLCGLYLLVVKLISSSFGVLIKQFKARHISDYPFSFLGNLGRVIVVDDGKISLFILQLIQSLMDSIVLLVVLDEFGLIDLWRKGHHALVFIFDALLQGVGLLADLRLVVGLRIQELFQISRVFAVTAIDGRLECAVRHCPVVYLSLQRPQFLASIIQVLL